MSKKVGYVYYANSRRIDSSDNKERRRYVVVRDDGKNVGVSKIRGYNSNSKNIVRLYPLPEGKYPLSKKSGVDKKVYTRKANSKTKLSLTDKSVFDDKHLFKLSSHDTHNVLVHTGRQGIKKKRT